MFSTGIVTQTSRGYKYTDTLSIRQMQEQLVEQKNGQKIGRKVRMEERTIEGRKKRKKR
jgi:hypothetical protein